MLILLNFILFVGGLSFTNASPTHMSPRKILNISSNKQNVQIDSKIKITLDYEDMVLFEAQVVHKIVNVFIDKVQIIPKNPTNAQKRSDCKQSKTNKQNSRSIGSTSQGATTIFEELNSILEQIENAELKKKYRQIIAPFIQFLEQINSAKSTEIEANKLIVFQTKVAIALGLAITQSCLREDGDNKEQTHNWWRVFRSSFPDAIMSAAQQQSSSSDDLRKTLNQHCMGGLRRYEMLKNQLEKDNHLHKSNLKVKKDLFDIKLVALNGEPVDKSKIEIGELDNATPIVLSVYELNSYKKFKHIALLLGDIEIHYGFYGVRLTKFGGFAKPGQLKFTQKVLLSNVYTNFSVRQIQSVLDYLELGPYRDYHFVEKNCSDFTKDLIKWIAVTQSKEGGVGTYPPDSVEYLEWRAQSTNGNAIKLVSDPDVYKKKFEEVDFLNNPYLVRIVKNGPEPVKKFMRGFTEAKTAFGGMRKKKF